MKPAEEPKKNTIENALKIYGQTQDAAQTQEQQKYAQYQQYQQYIQQQQQAQYPANATYGYGANPAAYPYQYSQQQQQQQQQQYQQYYQQYYAQQQQQQQHPHMPQQQQQAYYQQQYSQYGTGQQGYYAQQQAQYYARQQHAHQFQAQPPVSQVVKTQVPLKQETSKVSNDPNYDPLLEEIKRTVLNDQRLHKKTKWSSEVTVPEDIYQYFEKQPEKKRSEYNIRNLFDDAGKLAFEKYLRRSFNKCENAKEQQHMSSMLLNTVIDLLQNEDIDKVNWETHPMPILPRENIQKPTALPVSELALAAAQNNPLNSFTPFNIPGFNLNNAAYVMDPATANTSTTQPTASSTANPSASTGQMNNNSGNNSNGTTGSSYPQQHQQQYSQSQQQHNTQQSQAASSSSFNFANQDSFSQQKQQQQDSKTTTSTTPSSTGLAPKPLHVISSSQILPFSISTQPTYPSASTSSSSHFYQNSHNPAYPKTAYPPSTGQLNNSSFQQSSHGNFPNNSFSHSQIQSNSSQIHQKNQHIIADEVKNKKLNDSHLQNSHGKQQAKDKKHQKNEQKLAQKIIQQEQQQQQQQASLQLSMTTTDNDTDLDSLLTKWNIVGTCTDIEKPYLRLTKEPTADQVRPEEILKKSLKMLLGKWRERECDYAYIQSQFRSIRQDLIIQHINNDFTAKVCEYNARICLEVDDHGQYVQCCATLFDLYKFGIKGEREEFYCYKIIDAGLNPKPTLELPKLIYEVSLFIDHPLIKFAMDLLRAHQAGNFYKFFQLYEKSPNMCYIIIEKRITRIRLWALTIISKAYQPKITLDELINLLKFDDIDHARDFIKSSGGILDGNEVLLRDSHKGFVDTYQKI